MKKRSQAFTRWELAASVGAVALGAALVLPSWAGSRGTAQRAGCFNNLRQIGHAVQLWGNDRDDRTPWITPVTDGGTQPVPIGGKTAIAWVEFITLSNELVNPQVLACPSDSAAKVASDWGNMANGLANSGLRGNALSYFISYHCQPNLPRSVVTGDRDFRPSSTTPGGCSRGPINVLPIFFGDFNVAWTNALHVGAGHLLFTDASVDYVSSSKLPNALAGPGANDVVGGSVHFINAR